MTADFEIQHDEDTHQFFIDMPDGDPAFVKYRIWDQDTDEPKIDIFSTFVPEQHRSKKLAQLLVDHVLKWARGLKLEIHASCWYAELVIQRQARSSSTNG